MEIKELQERKHVIGQLSSQGVQYMRDGDLQNAVLNYKKAYKLAREINNDKIERSCAFNLGAAFIAWDKPSEGMEYLHKALPPDGQIDDRSNGDLYFNMGLGHEKMENKRKALVDFIKAYEEYANRESERVDEQIQCLEKCLDIYKSWNNRPKMAETCKNMAEVFERRKDSLGRADRLCEQALVLRQDGKQNDAVSVAEDCMNLLNNTHTQLEGEDCTVAAKILNDMGLVFTQLQKYDEATSCFEKAVKMVNKSHKIHPQLEAVVLQNLGAAYNLSNDFQRAIRYHKDAAAKYAKINYRNGQGQCFTNLAFALSQQGDMKRAEVAFHHALQASKDTGDNHMRWQALEGIGAVNYNQGNFEEAINFFRKALRYVGENTAACERITSKFNYAKEAQGQSVTPNRGQGQTMQQWAPAGIAGYRASAVDPTPHRPLMPTKGPSEEHSQMSATPRSQMMVEEQILAQKSAPMAGEQPRMSSVQDEKPRSQVSEDSDEDDTQNSPRVAEQRQSATSDGDKDKNPYASIDTTAKLNQRGVEGQGNNTETVTRQQSMSGEGHLKGQHFFDSEGSIENSMQPQDSDEKGPSKDTEDESAMEKLPRGQREIVLAQYHQEHRSQEPPDLPDRKGEKNSKTCIIM